MTATTGRIIAAARQRGSTATTRAGAARYLRRLLAEGLSTPDMDRWQRLSRRESGPFRLRRWPWGLRPHRPRYWSRAEWRRDQVGERYRQAFGLPTREEWEAATLAPVAELMRQHGPIPPREGAGALYETVRYARPGVTAPYCEFDRTPGDQRSVARSYGYRVWDLHVTWRIPYGWTLRLVAGVVTLVPESGPVTEVWWPVRSRGYSGRWVRGRLSSAAAVLRIANIEHRRAAVELYGPARLLAELGTERTLWGEDRYGRLYRVPLVHDDPLMLLDVTCPSTGRQYLLRVPPWIATPHEGVAWSFGLDRWAYHPAFEA